MIRRLASSGLAATLRALLGIRQEHPKHGGDVQPGERVLPDETIPAITHIFPSDEQHRCVGVDCGCLPELRFGLGGKGVLILHRKMRFAHRSR